MTLIISKNMVLPTEAIYPPFPLTHPRIGYLSVCTEDNLVASSSAAGFPVSALVNTLTYDQWRPEVGNTSATVTCTLDEADDCDYIGIAAHNLGTINATVTAEYSTDGVTFTELDAFGAGDNSPIMLHFNAVLGLVWRVTFAWPDSAQQLKIGCMKIGATLQMQRRIYGGHSPITLSRVTEKYPTRSDLGQFLGHSVIRKGVRSAFAFKHLTADWYREFFDPFVKYARSEAFFIAWRPSAYKGEVAYGYIAEDVSPVNMGIRDLMSVEFSVQGITDD